MKTITRLLRLACVLLLGGVLAQCTGDAPTQPEDSLRPQRLEARAEPPAGRWLADYLPLSPQRHGTRWYFWLDSDEWDVVRVAGTETIPYESGEVQATVLASDGDRYGFVEDGGALWYLAVRANYYLSTDCALTAFPPDKVFGRVQDGDLLDGSGPAFYVRKDLGACIPVTGFGPDQPGLLLVKESDVDLLGDRYRNALVLWEVQPGVPFKEVFFWGAPGDLFGIRRATALQLEREGLTAERIALCPLCTVAEPLLFRSWRRDGVRAVQWSGVVSQA